MSNASRALLGAVLLVAAVGCGGSTEFEIERTFQVQGAGPIDASQAVSLRDVAGDAWDQRDKIDAVKVTSATATITAVAPANTATTGTVSGHVARGTGAALERVEVVAGTGAILVGTTLEGRNLGEASALVKRALEGDGQLGVDLSASLPEGTNADFTVDVLMKVEADWSLF